MDPVELNDRLSRINTLWTKVLRAHGDDTAAANAAKCVLLERYQRAVYRYLLGAVRDADVAEELAQEFALRFVRGDFKGANPERGRFRNYLKTSLVHLVTDYHRARQQAPIPLPEAADPAAAEDINDETSFAANWRQELLERTWQALREFNETYHAALQLRIENPDMTSAAMAARLTTTLGKDISAALVRKALQRAHEKFADLLLEEVATSMDAATNEELEVELKELDLLRYCKSALDRRKG
jgi:RNA polymerase sigma factor (sigma-70 family)